MSYLPLDITIISADDLKDVNLVTKMDVYVQVTVSGDPRTAQNTPVHKDGGKSPRWNYRLSLPLAETMVNSNACVVFRIVSDRVLGDREIGQVAVPVKELKDGGGGDGERVLEYKVRTSSGKTKGMLKFSYKFGDKIAMPKAPAPPPVAAAPPSYAAPPPSYAAPPPSYAGEGKSSSEPVTAYPPPPHSAGYPPPPYAQPYAPPPQMGYGYPPQPGYGYPQAPAYGPPGYSGYGVVPPKKKKQGMGGLGLGLGAGLLGGLLVGDMMSDAAAYDAGYDNGFGDGGGFDGGFDF